MNTNAKARAGSVRPMPVSWMRRFQEAGVVRAGPRPREPRALCPGERTSSTRLFDRLAAFELFVLKPVTRRIGCQLALEGFRDGFCHGPRELARPCRVVVLQVGQHLFALLDADPCFADR